MHTYRIFWKLLFSYLVVIFVTLFAISFLSSRVISSSYEKQTVLHLTEQAALLEDLTRDAFASNDVAVIRDIGIAFGSKISARVTLVDMDGVVISDSKKSFSEMRNHRGRPEIQAAMIGKTGQSIRHSNTLQKSMLYIAVPVIQHDKIVGVVRLAVSLAEMERVVAGVRLRVFFGGIVILILLTLVSLFMSRHISRPLELIKHGVADFAKGDFSKRLHTSGSTEVNALAETMNDMADQLEDRLDTVEKERNQREAVLSSMVEGVLAVDVDGHIISLNKAAAEIFNVFHPEDAPGRSFEEVFRNVELQRFAVEVLDSQETHECELVVQSARDYNLQVRGATLFGPQGIRLGAVIVFNDVSRLRRLENLRSEFVANVSHELKTPITSIKGFVETLLDGAMNDKAEAERFLQIISKHADRLNAIINDLLTLSRLEQEDSKEVELRKTDLGAVIHSSIEICSFRAENKKIKVKVKNPDKVSAVINPPLIEQALINLIGNAIKYSPNSSTVTVSTKQNENGSVQLSVKDKGCGIAPEHIDRLFERFYRVDKGRSRQEGGTGLGLAIVKHISQIHGGSVSVDSTFGQGSVFTIYLPAG